MSLSKEDARRLWIQAQGLDTREPFGSGPKATQTTVEHLGYVQIDTINVIERCHHHILYNRIPDYRREHLWRAQSQEKSVFEYWTHALSYVPTRDYRYFTGAMRRIALDPGQWFRDVKPQELQRVIRLIKKDGALSIRDIEDEVLVEKNHPWASRKPSKKALQLGFYMGKFVISERIGMLKKYELRDRHFGWERPPRLASEKEINVYLLERSLRSQAVVSLDSICHLKPSLKPGLRRIIDQRVKLGELIPVSLRGYEKVPHWIRAADFRESVRLRDSLVQILSPFDPLIIQRKRLKCFFDYEHLFEAYLPKEKRKLGYFALPVLIGDQIVAALDLKTDREAGILRVQKWTWMRGFKSMELKRAIETELGRFERFQLNRIS